MFGVWKQVLRGQEAGWLREMNDRFLILDAVAAPCPASRTAWELSLGGCKWSWFHPGHLLLQTASWILGDDWLEWLKLVSLCDGMMSILEDCGVHQLVVSLIKFLVNEATLDRSLATVSIRMRISNSCSDIIQIVHSVYNILITSGTRETLTRINCQSYEFHQQKITIPVQR